MSAAPAALSSRWAWCGIALTWCHFPYSCSVDFDRAGLESGMPYGLMARACLMALSWLRACYSTYSQILAAQNAPCAQGRLIALILFMSTHAVAWPIFMKIARQWSWNVALCWFGDHGRGVSSSARWLRLKWWNHPAWLHFVIIASSIGNDVGISWRAYWNVSF